MVTASLLAIESCVLARWTTLKLGWPMTSRRRDEPIGEPRDSLPPRELIGRVGGRCVDARGVIRLPRWGRGAQGACFPGVQSHPWQHSRIPLGCEGGEAGRQGSQISDLRGQMGVGCEGGEAGSQI